MLLYNAIKTPDGTILVSKSRHDYVTHEDKNGFFYAVDGGSEYAKRSTSTNAPPYEELSVYDDGDFEKRRKYFVWGSRYDKEGVPLDKLIMRPIMELDTDHIEAILRTQTQINEMYKDTFEKELRWRKRDETIDTIL
jgi:hypothetical protein